MHKGNIKGKIQLTSYDDLLSGGVNHNQTDITEMPLINLHEFENHPFHVVDDERMSELVESIKEKGVLSPAIVRKRVKGGYEIISGHRRKRACQLAGLHTMPVIIKDLDDDEATILMVDANIQRENILPSERAFSLQMKMKALKNQGRRTDLTSDQVGPKLASKEIGEENGISSTQVKRYICLTNLLPEILEKVDSGKIGFIPAVELSFVKEREQKWIEAVLRETDKKVSLKQAQLLRRECEEGVLTEDKVCDIILGKRATMRTVTLAEADLKKFFSEDMDSGHIKRIIMNLLKQWKEETENG